MTEAEYKDQHPEYDEYESEVEQPSEMTLADALKICDCVNFSYFGMSEREREELDTAFDLVWRAADKYLKSLQNITAGDCVSRSYLKQMIPAPIEDEYKRVHQIIDNAPTVELNSEYGAIQYSNGFNDGFTAAKDTIIQNIAKQYIEHNELVPSWLSIGDIKGGAENATDR